MRDTPADDPWTWHGDWAGPVVATAIHAGHDVRPDLAALMSLPEDVRLREEDPHTDAIGALVPSRVAVHRCRFEVDLNRDREHSVYRRPDDCWGLTVWDTGTLDDALAEESRALHDRFYAELAERLDPVAARGPFVLFDVHSYNHRRDGAHGGTAAAEDNPEVNVGTGSLDRDRFGRVVDTFIAALASVGTSTGPLDVRENVRFRGANLAAWVHRRYPGVGCALALEFKKTFMDEWTGVVDAARIGELAEALASTVGPVTEALRELDR